MESYQLRRYKDITWKNDLFYPFRQANDGPHWATEGTTTAEAAAEKPANVDGQVFPEGGVDPADCGFELLGGHAGVKGGWEVGVEPIGKPKSEIIFQIHTSTGIVFLFEN